MGNEVRRARGSSWASLSFPLLSSVLGSVAKAPLDLPKMETGQNTIGEVVLGTMLGVRPWPPKRYSLGKCSLSQQHHG